MTHLALASTDQDLFRRLCLSLEGVASVDLVAYDTLGIARDIARLKPSLLLIDVGHGTGIAGSMRDVVEAARVVDRRLEILVLGDAQDPTAVLQAIRAGSVDFFDRTEDLDSVRTHLFGRQAAFAAEKRAAPGAFTVVLNGQPGNGENQLAINLALLRARRAGEGLLIDCALPSSETGAALDLNPGYTMYDAVRDLDRLDRTFVLSALARYEPVNLHVLALVAQNNVEEPLSPENFLAALGTIRSLFQETVLNAGGLRHGPLLSTISEAATDILLVCPQKYTALRDCKSLLALLPTDKDLRRRITLVIDDYDTAINLGEIQMRDTLGLEQSCRLPAARTDLINGLNLGRPFVLDAARSPYVVALEALAFPGAAAARPKGLGALRAMVANLAGAASR
jgi:pilus assembly protein CpaE